MATAGGDGRVDDAIYSVPHVLEDGVVAFFMRDRLSHRNIQENPHATFLFMEDGPGSRGLCLFLKKIKEETDPAAIKTTPHPGGGSGPGTNLPGLLRGGEGPAPDR